MNKLTKLTLASVMMITSGFGETTIISSDMKLNEELSSTTYIIDSGVTLECGPDSGIAGATNFVVSGTLDLRKIDWWCYGYRTNVTMKNGSVLYLPQILGSTGDNIINGDAAGSVFTLRFTDPNDLNYSVTDKTITASVANPDDYKSIAIVKVNFKFSGLNTGTAKIEFANKWSVADILDAGLNTDTNAGFELNLDNCDPDEVVTLAEGTTMKLRPTGKDSSAITFKGANITFNADCSEMKGAISTNKSIEFKNKGSSGPVYAMDTLTYSKTGDDVVKTVSNGVVEAKNMTIGDKCVLECGNRLIIGWHNYEKLIDLGSSNNKVFELAGLEWTDMPYAFVGCYFMVDADLWELDVNLRNTPSGTNSVTCEVNLTEDEFNGTYDKNILDYTNATSWKGSDTFVSGTEGLKKGQLYELLEKIASGKIKEYSAG